MDCKILSLLYNNDAIVIYISWRLIESLDLSCIKIEFMVRFNEYESVSIRNGIVELHCNRNSFRNLRSIEANNNQMKNVYKLVSIVGETLESLEWLDLSGSDLMEFDFNILSKMKQLEMLHISNCNLKKVINPSVLQSIGMKYFLSGGNQIQNAHEIIEHLNPSIMGLYLSGSIIGELNSSAITKLKNLKRLDLSNTNLQMVDSHLFDQVEGLLDIDISNNNLDKMNFTISLPSSLLWLNVSGCQIENVLDLIQFQRTKLWKLDLSGNFVGTLNDTSFDQLTRLKILNLKNTSLSFSNSNPFHKLNGLRNLDISNNNLQNVDSTVLSSTSAHLMHLNVAECQIANALDLIKSLGSDIQRLNLSGNIVGKVNASTFGRFESLKTLHLSNTSLLNFDFDILEHSKELNELDISYNRFTKLNVSLNMDKLETLDLRGCEFNEIHNFDKIHFPKLGLLGISENEIISCESLERLKSEWLSLEFIDNDQSQNDQPNCHPANSIETTAHSVTEAYDNHD